MPGLGLVWPTVQDLLGSPDVEALMGKWALHEGKLGGRALRDTADPVGLLGQAGRTLLEYVQQVPTPVPPTLLCWALLAALSWKWPVGSLLRIAFTTD